LRHQERKVTGLFRRQKEEETYWASREFKMEFAAEMISLGWSEIRFPAPMVDESYRFSVWFFEIVRPLIKTS